MMGQSLITARYRVALVVSGAKTMHLAVGRVLEPPGELVHGLDPRQICVHPHAHEHRLPGFLVGNRVASIASIATPVRRASARGWRAAQTQILDCTGW